MNPANARLRAQNAELERSGVVVLSGRSQRSCIGASPPSGSAHAQFAGSREIIVNRRRTWACATNPRRQLATNSKAGKSPQLAQTRAISWYPENDADEEQPGQAGSRGSASSWNRAAKASKHSRRPTSGRPTWRISLITSLACNKPMMPGSTPRTPASLQFGASAADGGSANRQR